MDLLDRMRDLHKQATTEESHFYTARVLEEAMAEIRSLRTIVIRYWLKDDKKDGE